MCLNQTTGNFFWHSEITDKNARLATGELVLDELALAESRQLLSLAGLADGADTEKLLTPIHSVEELEALRATHALVLVKAIKTGCKHCEHLAPHFGAASAACSAAAAARETAHQQDGGKIAFAVAKDIAATSLFNVKS